MHSSSVQLVKFCFSEYKSLNGEAGVAAGFKRRGGGGLFSQQVDIIQVSGYSLYFLRQNLFPASR